jgi:hypothetical protein
LCSAHFLTLTDDPQMSDDVVVIGIGISYGHRRPRVSGSSATPATWAASAMRGPVIPRRRRAKEIPRFRPVATPSRRHARCSNPRAPTVDTIPRRPAAAATLRFPNEVTPTGYGVGLSSAVAAAVPNVVGTVIAEISRRPFG